MAIDPGDRFPSARAFAQALDAWRRRWSRTQALVAAGPIVAPVTEAAPNDAPTVASLEEEGDTLVAEPAASATPNGVPARGESDRALARFGPARARRVALPAALTVLGIAAVMVAASVAAFPGSGPSATPPASASGMLSESAAPSLASEVVIALASPTATVTSSASPTPRATPRATPRPTPRPTPAPTLVTTPSRTPRPTAPPVVVVGPAQQVVRFYARVAAHRFAAAADLWSAAMRGRYPPSTYIDGRFANTTRFDIRRASLTSRSGDQAIVAVDVVEHRSTSPTSEHWVGSWRLVRHAGTWLLDDPNLASA
jgi:hypothetical protein